MGQSNICNSFLIVSPVSVILLDMYVFDLDCPWCLYQDHLLYIHAVNEINHYRRYFVCARRKVHPFFCVIIGHEGLILV